MRRTLAVGVSLALALSWAGCNCGKTTAGGSSSGSGAAGSSGSGSSGSSGSTGSTGGTGSSGGSGGSSGSTGSTDLDAGLIAYCQGQGAPVVVGDSLIDGGTVATCAGNLAQRTFRFGLCTCEALAVDHPIDTDSFLDLPDGGMATRSNGAVGSDNGVVTVSNNAHLNVGGTLWVSDGGITWNGNSSVAAELHAGSSVNANASNISVGADAYCQADVSGNLSVGGKLFVNDGGTVAASVSAAGGVVRTAVNVTDPCDCTHLVDIAGIVAAHQANNDNAVIGLVAPDAGFGDAGLPANLYSGGSAPGDFTFPCGRYYLDGATIAQSTTWHVSGRTAVMINGDLAVNAGFRVDVPEGSELDLFISGSLTANQPMTVGNQGNASATRIYVGGSADIQLLSPSNFYGNIYAPLAKVVSASPASVYGSIFARAYNNSSPAHLHYDEAILASGTECIPSTPPDAGTLADGGAVVVDAGPPPACGSCTDCNNQACLLPADGGAGQCGACTDSTQCCAPLVCVSGTCTVPLR